MRTIKLIFLLSVLLPGPALTQVSVKLQVRNAETNETVKAAEAFVPALALSQLSDSEGRIILDIPGTGSLRLIIFSFEYETRELVLDVARDTSLFVDISPLQEQFSQVLISARRDELFALRKLNAVEDMAIYSSRKTEVLNIDALLANKASNNARQIFANAAGMNIFESSEGGLQLNVGARGLDPNRSANFNVRQNGYDISADVLGYPESYYTPPADAIDEIQIVRGAASLQYGTQFGGLLNFRLKKPPVQEGIHIKLRQSLGSFGLFNSFNSFAYRKKNLGTYAFVNFRRGDGYRNFSGYKSLNLYGRVDLDIKPNAKLILEHSYFNYLAQQAGGLTDEQFLEDPRMASRERNWFKVNWNLSSLQYRQKITDNTRLKLNVFALNAGRDAIGFRGTAGALNVNPITELDERNVNGEYINARDLIVGRFRNIGAEIRFLHSYYHLFGKANDKLKAPNTLLAGAKFYTADNSSEQGPGSRGTDADFSLREDMFPDYPNRSDFDFPNDNIALFAENIFNITDRLSVTPGLRYEYILTRSEGVYNRLVFDNAGNVLLNETLDDNRRLKRNFVLLGIGASYKLSAQSEIFTNVTENYRSVTFSDIRVVNPSFIIDPEIRDESGYSFDLGWRGVHKSVLSYDFGLFTILYDDRIGIILDDRANRVRKNIGTARILGIESLLQWNISKTLDPENKDYKLNSFINLALSDSEYIESEENNVEGKQLEFVPSVNLRTGLSGGYKDLLFNVQYSYIGRQFTDVENSSVANPGDSRAGLIGPIPAYSVVDISLSYSYSKYNLECGINNLMGNNYFTQRATGYPGPGIIPSAGRNFYISLSYDFFSGE